MQCIFLASGSDPIGDFGLEHSVEKCVCRTSVCETFVDVLTLFSHLVSEMLPIGTLLLVMVTV